MIQIPCPQIGDKICKDDNVFELDNLDDAIYIAEDENWQLTYGDDGDTDYFKWSPDDRAWVCVS